MNAPLPDADTVTEQANDAALGGANPLLGLSRRQLARATGRFAVASARHAPTVAGAGLHLAGELGAAADDPAPGRYTFS